MEGVRPAAPQPLGDQHRLDAFDSGVASLDDWLRRRARTNQLSGASRTLVATLEPNQVVAYYALASSSITIASATGRFRRNMPEPVPVALLGRLAVDRCIQGRGVGRALLRDATLRVMNAAEVLGIHGMVVHALSEEARAFYLALGFDTSPIDPMMLMISLTDAQGVFS